MHRYLLTAAACLGFIAIAAGGITAGAQVDAAELDSRLAGYPELTIRLTADGLEAPATAAAGRTLLIEENVTEAPGHAFLFRVPDDVSDDELAAVLAVEASAAEVTPEWFWRADFAGIGDRAALEQPARALVDLLPGRYVAGDPYRPPTEYAQFVVTGETGETGATAPAAGPAADVVAELFEMGFTLPAEIASGRQVWEVRNTGAMLHEIAIVPVPEGAASADLEAAMSAVLMAEMHGGTPDLAELGPEWAGWSGLPVAGVSVLSPQSSSLAQIDLEPGVYGVVCFVPEPTSMTPHLMLGMSDVFTVTDGGAGA